MNPEHAASRSKAAAFRAPIFCCTRHAVEGNGMSGVMVATRMGSSCSPVTPAIFIARCAAFVAKSEVNSSAEASRRSLMPVREVIHSSDVSTIFSRSKFVNTFAGKYEPTPAMETERPLKSCWARGFLNLGDDEVGGVMQRLLQARRFPAQRGARSPARFRGR